MPRRDAVQWSGTDNGDIIAINYQYWYDTLASGGKRPASDNPPPQPPIMGNWYLYALFNFRVLVLIWSRDTVKYHRQHRTAQKRLAGYDRQYCHASVF